MYKRVGVLMTVAALATSVSPARAGQDDPDEQVQYLEQVLQLSPEQSTQVARILATDRQLAGVYLDQFRENRQELAAETRKRIAETVSEIGQVLGASQKEQFHKLSIAGSLTEEACRLSGRLALDAVQAVQVNTIMSQSPMFGARDAMRGGGAPPEDRRARMQEMRAAMEDIDKQIEQILTEDQKLEYEKMKAERRERVKQERGRDRSGIGMGGRGGRGGGGWR
jgi:hypothetical protein